MEERHETGYSSSMMSCISENIYVRVGLVVIYFTVWGLSILGMYVVVLVEKFHWKTPAVVKLFGGTEVFASINMSLFFIMQNLTFDLLEHYRLHQLLQRSPSLSFWMSRDS